MPASAPAARVRGRTTLSAPVTALAPLPGGRTALVGSGRTLALVSLNSPSPTRPSRTWTVFSRERIHRIVLADPRPELGGPPLRALVVGGKEAVLVHLDHVGDDLEVVQRFHLDDFAGDAAFLNDDHILISTLHNAVHVYELSLPSLFSSSALPPVDLASSSTRPIYSLDASQRPTLWCARFDRPHYRSAEAQGEEEDGIRLAGGSLWGDTFLWDVGSAAGLREKAIRAAGSMRREVEAAAQETLRRLAGHKGAVFTAAFSPCTRFLVTGSDDRTLRVWDLALLPPRPAASASTSAQPAATEEHPHLALWGHSARVWRAVFLAPTPGPPRPPPPSTSSIIAAPAHSRTSIDELGIASVAEDGTARVWRVSPAALDPSAARTSSSASAGDKGYVLVATFRDGHDGRSLWAVEGAGTGASEDDGRRVVLTGGADGAVRTWTVPQSGSVGSASAGGASSGSVSGTRKGLKVKAFVAVESAGGEEDERDLVVVLRDDGSFVTQNAPSTSTSSATSSSLSFDLEPFHTSPIYGGVSASCILRIVPPPNNGASSRSRDVDFLAFSNRGGFLRARLSRAGALLGKVFEAALDVRPALTATRLQQDGHGRVRVAVWDRAAWTVALLEVDLLDEPQRAAPTVIASIVLPADPPRAPTALHLLTPSLLLVGTASGSLELYSTRACGALERLGVVEHVHAGGVVDVSVRADEQSAAWAATSVGRDGVRCRMRVEVVGEEGELSARFERMDERALHAGGLEQIVSFNDCSDLYLGRGNGRAVLLDHLGQQIHSFGNSSKKLPSQLVGSRSGALRFYCIASGQLNIQSASSASSASSAVLHTGLHGREVRAIAALRTQKGTAIVATAAENGVLSVSELRSDSYPEPLWTARHLPSALKALAWSPRSSLSSSELETHTLFVCGAQELLQAYVMSYASSSTGGKGDGLEVLRAGQVVGSECGEVRAMDLAVAQAGTAAEGRHLVAVGYSDGSLKIWAHDASLSTFSLIMRSNETSKCILTVELIELELSEVERRWIVATGASDGLLALRDVTSLVRPSSSPQAREVALPAPFFSFRPHQSGVNALALCSSQCNLLIATGGDDNAVSVASLEISSSAALGDPIRAELVDQASLADAHASSIQGLDFLSPTLLASSSVEQRLNLYSLSRRPTATTTPSPKLELELCDSTPLDVADCGAQAVLHHSAGELLDEGERGRWQVLVAGIGVEVVNVGEAGALP